MSDLRVGLSPALRSWTASLALTGWPAREQAEKPHAVHGQARLLRKFFAGRAADAHPLIGRIDGRLAAGEPLARIGRDLLDEESALAAIARDTGLDDFWRAQAAVWQAAVIELEAIFAGAPLPAFLEKMSGRPPAPVHLMPNYLYPALRPLVLPPDTALWVLVPPPPAWGESPPWPFAEGREWLLSQTCRALLDAHLETAGSRLAPRPRTLLVEAATTLFLEQALGAPDGLSYLFQTSRQQDLPELPDLVGRLRQALDGGQPAAAIAQLFSTNP